MANLQYIGARYVPKFFENPDDQSNAWKAGVDYEALTIVTYNNDSYTSKITVPDSIGDPASNPQYWACTTKYTAALVALQTTVGDHEDRIDDLEAKSDFYVTPEMYGAIADGVHNDYDAIQSAIDSGYNVMFAPKSYYIGSNTIKIETLGTYICATGSTIIYDGVDYAIRFRRINQKCVDLGSVIAENGSCIELYSGGYTLSDPDRVQYLNLTFDTLIAQDNCIHGTATGATSWVNEIRISKGRLEGGAKGIFIEHTNSTGELNGWRVDNVAIEGVTDGIILKSTVGEITAMKFDNIRVLEVSSGNAFEIVGGAYDIEFNTPDQISKQNIAIDNGARGILINAPLFPNAPGGGVPLAYHTMIARGNNWVYDLPETLTIEYNSGTVNANYTRVRRIGLEIDIKLTINGVTLGAGDALCTLPYAPVANFIVYDNNGVAWQVLTTGVISPLAAVNNASFTLDTSFIYYVPFA